MTSPDARVATLAVAEACEQLCAPDALERFGALTGAVALCIDLARETGAPVPSASRVETACETLRRLPAPTLALHAADAPPRLAPLARACDVAVDDAARLAPVLGGVRAQPLAAMTLVQLLRLGEGLGVHDALVAESLAYSTLQSGPGFARWCEERGGARRRSAEPAAPPVAAARWNDVLAIELDRPARHNAFSRAMRDALVEALVPALVDPTIREVRVSGRGPSFCSGGDLDEFGTLPEPATAHAVRSTRSAARVVADLAPRLRFRVHGACIGAGVELAAFAARVVAREDAFFALPELALGLVPGSGGTVSLPRRIGRQRTAWLALSGERIDAIRAEQWGLIDEVELLRGPDV